VSKLRAWLSGKKTYGLVIVGAILGGLHAAGFEIPDWVWPLLGAAGFGSLRAGVSKAARERPSRCIKVES